jgi:hypothetical protein
MSVAVEASKVAMIDTQALPYYHDSYKRTLNVRCPQEASLHSIPTFFLIVPYTLHTLATNRTLS